MIRALDDSQLALGQRTEGEELHDWLKLCGRPRARIHVWIDEDVRIEVGAVLICDPIDHNVEFEDMTEPEHELEEAYSIPDVMGAEAYT